jgi:hypothetical protein
VNPDSAFVKTSANEESRANSRFSGLMSPHYR